MALYAKALELTLVKELGKMAPSLRDKGCPSSVKPTNLVERERVAVKRLV